MAYRQPYAASPSSTHLPESTPWTPRNDNANSTTEFTQSDFKFGTSFSLSLDDPPASNPTNPYSSQGQQYLSPTLTKPAAAASDSSFNLSDSEFENNKRILPPASPDWQPQQQPRYPQENSESFIRQLIFPKSLTSRLYLGTVLLETVLDLAIEATLLSQVNNALSAEEEATNKEVDTSKTRLPVYLGIFALAHVFQATLALDAVLNRNTLQFVFLAIFNALLCVYAILQIGEVQTLLVTATTGNIPIKALTITIPIIVGLAEVAYIALGWKIYGEFGWSVYKLIGANRRMKYMYGQYQVFQSLIRFSTFFWLGFSVQLIALVLKKADFEFYVTIIALPLSILLLYEGHLAARHESKWMMGTFMMGCVAALVYFIYKLVRIWTQRTTATYKSVYKSLSVFALISIIILLITCVWATLVLRNFNQGLKTQLSKEKAQKAAYRQDELEMGGPATPRPGWDGKPGGANPSRMSIE